MKKPRFLELIVFRIKKIVSPTLFVLSPLFRDPFQTRRDFDSKSGKMLPQYVPKILAIGVPETHSTLVTAVIQHKTAIDQFLGAIYVK